jgi:hypothetical protein
MFARCKQLIGALTPDTAENLADLFYEIGKQALTTRNYEVAVSWLERAFNMLGEQDFGMLDPEAGELRLSIMQSLGKFPLLTRISIIDQMCSPGAHEAEDPRGDRQGMASGQAYGE